jgi:uracil-DNA glycosylase
LSLESIHERRREMNPADFVQCGGFPCQDVNHDAYLVPRVELDPKDISILLISEAVPERGEDYYYAGEDASYQQTTLQAFQAAGANVDSFSEISDLGVYFTTAVKCGKTSYGIKAGIIRECSQLLEKELDLFPNVKAYMLMGDVAIKAVNYIAKRTGEGRVVPAGSTYKIRGQAYFFRGARVFPSYLQVGPSYGIEKSKQRMIAEDICAALKFIS